MQGITVAISPAGVQFFSQKVLMDKVTSVLTDLKPLDKTIPVPNDITYPVDGGCTLDCSGISIALSNGSLKSFSPDFESVQQQPNGQFQLSFNASKFSASYTWNETYTSQKCCPPISQPGSWICYPEESGGNQFDYSPEIGNLETAVTFQFQFDSTQNAWTFPVTAVKPAPPTNIQSNIPSDSVLQHQESTGCANWHVNDTTASSVDSIDFKTPMATLFGSMLDSIPASGNLTPDIVFKFGLGDAGLTFPNDQGIAIGATGVSTYKGQPYPGTSPTGLPVPSVPTDHHLQMYVSNYAINGLYWAFALDGKLTSTVQPSDLNDPTMLDVSTYYNSIPVTDPLKKLLTPYRMKVMFATVTPQGQGATIQAPTVAFQTVYVFNPTTMKALQNVLPSNVYQSLSTSSIGSNAYTNTTDLESDLSAVPIDSSYFATIEKTIEMLGAVVTHNLQFTLTIQGATIPGGSDTPSLTFTLTRQDILTDLKLGITTPTAPAKPAQTLQFTHTECQPPPVVTLTASNFIPVTPENGVYFIMVWNSVGENEYATLLAQLGKTGVPLPIMEGFQFVFDQALLNLEQGYVGILSNVKFTS